MQQNHLIDCCDIGMKQFNDDAATFYSLPSNLYGATYLQLNKNETDLSFTVNENADVFVAVPDNIAKPEWLKEFDDSKTMIENNSAKAATFAVYRKRYNKNEQVALHTQGVPVSIFALPVYNLQPAYDLKPVVSYKPLQATVSADADRTTVNGKDAVTFTTNKASVAWNINTGVGDVYSITVRYANETGKDLQALLELYAADGTLMKTERMVFTASQKGKWNYAITNTGSMINAGNYIIKIKASDAVGLSVAALDIQ